MKPAAAPETSPGATTGTPAAARQTLRQRAIERRLALTAAQWTQLSAVICEHLSAHFPELAAHRVGFCWPIRNEPDLRPLMRSWLARGAPGFAALLPVVVAEQAPLAFRRWTPDCAMAPDRYAIPTPSAGAYEVPTALLIPVNAFDAEGFRLGYGGGYFDRTLSALQRLDTPPRCIGVGFELARVDSIHPQAHDIRLDAIVTEAGVFATPR